MDRDAQSLCVSRHGQDAGAGCLDRRNRVHPAAPLEHEAGNRVTGPGGIESVLDFARVRGWRDGENPARWKGNLDHILPRRSKVRAVEHHAALPWRNVGAFMVALAGQKGMAAMALRFTVLTTARTGEVLGATWGESTSRQNSGRFRPDG